MKLRLQFRRWATIAMAVLTIVLAFFFVKPVSANNAVTPAAVTQPTNQPNAPNAGSQATQQSSELTVNSQQTNQSTSVMASDGANANKSANTAAKSTENELSTDKAISQLQQNAATKSNNSQILNLPKDSSNVIPQETLTTEQAAQAKDGQEVTAGNVNAKINVNGKDVQPGDKPQINQYTPVDVHLDFNLTGQTIHPNDYFKFTIDNPGNILNIEGSPSISLKNSAGQEIAVVTMQSGNDLISGQVTFTTGGNDAVGEFDVQLKVDESKANQTVDVPVTITLPNDHRITATFHYVPGTDSPEEEFSKYSFNNTLGPDKSKPEDTNPDYYTPDDITKGNLTYALRLIHHKGDAKYTEATVTDELQTPGFTYDKSSFLLYKTHWDYSNGHWSYKTLTNVSGYKLTFGPNDQSFTMDFGTPSLKDGDGYVIFYRLLYNGEPVNKITNLDDKPANKSIIHNQAELTRPGRQTITYPQTMEIQGSDGKAKVDDFSITVTKVWDDANNQDGKRPTSITVHLWNGETEVASHSISEASGWMTTFTNLERYDSQKNPINYTVTEDSVDGYTTEINGYTITNTHTPATTSVTVTKKWDDGNNQDGIRPDNITVQLQQIVDGVKDPIDYDDSVTLSAAKHNWTHTWTDLPEYQNGKKVTYKVKELSVTGYKTSYQTDAKTGNITITNTHTPTTIPATTSVTVTKKWDDGNNQDGIRPDKVQVQLLQTIDGQTESTNYGDPVALDADNDWTHTWTDLPQYQNGKKVTYTVKESEIAGYTANYDTKTGILTNTHTPATTSVAVTKQWVDDNNQDGIRPDKVTVQLQQIVDGQKFDYGDPVTLNTGNNWTHTWTELPQYQNGKKVTYTVKESEVAGYTANYDIKTGILTNTHTPATTSVAVTKQWVDGNNQDGIRPDKVTVQLQQIVDGQKFDYGDPVTLNTGNNWTHTWTELPQYQNGKKVTYTVKESEVAGYTANYDIKTGILTNTHTPATTSVAVTKQWVDGNNQDGIRPDKVTVQLQQIVDGQKFDYGDLVTLNTGNNWTHTWTDLPQYQNGKKVTYTVKESEVAGYTANYDTKTGILTNTYTPATTSVAVTKQWVDGNNQDGIRPGSVQVQLKRTVDGQTTSDDPITLDAANGWTYTWSKLPQYQNGKKVTYTVEELPVTGYEASYQTDAKSGKITITNTHTPATISKTVTKKWVDNDNQDGLRPDTIKVNLLANGKLVKTIDLTAKNNWTATIDGLAQKANGQNIDYTWEEVNVPTGYQVDVDGDVITNTHTPATISKTVTKQWIDNDNQDGLRPDTIKVNLLANGKLVKTIDLIAKNNWTATIDGLAQKANGQNIDYTWEEADVPAGYQADVDGDVITNTHTPATVSKTVTKQWIDNDNQDGLRPDMIKVNLLANGKLVKTIDLTAKNNWTATIDGLAQKANGQNIDYTWEEADVPNGYQAAVDGDVITNTHTPATISKTVTKQWNDNGNQDGIRPSTIKVNLLANGKLVKTIDLTAANNWTATIDGLAQKANGQDINYTWEEADVPAGYQAVVDGDVIINMHTPATISKTVTKKWVDNDNQDGLRPDMIKVNLLANGKLVKTIDLTAANNWTTTIDSLAQKANGQDIDYTWQEADVPAGYQVAEDGDVITNTHVPATISKTVTKQWVDNDNQDGIRPGTIKVNLLANGQVIRTIDLTAANNWTATIDGLAQKANGQYITYTWEEADVPAGYQAVVDGDVIINTHTPATISKTVTKQWVDNDNQDGIRPGSIKVNLLANGQVIRTIDLTAANNWTATIDGLAKKANGQDITYTWEEANVPAGYESKVDGDVIINTHAPLTTKVTVTKVWNDADNKDGLRPASVTINLLANGQVIRTVELNATNDWQAEFDDLMMYSHQGQQIVYTVEEANVPAGYQSAVSQDGLNFTVTNTHQPTTPDQPTKPTEPTTPVTPEQPDQPTKPTEPTTPVTPEQPSQPTTPTEPTTPVTPGQPVQPETPVVPGQPNVPGQPAQPSQPASQGQPRLPQTGNHDGFALVALGLVLLSMTIYVGKQRD